MWHAAILHEYEHHHLCIDNKIKLIKIWITYCIIHLATNRYERSKLSAMFYHIILCSPIIYVHWRFFTMDFVKQCPNTYELRISRSRINNCSTLDSYHCLKTEDNGLRELCISPIWIKGGRLYLIKFVFFIPSFKYLGSYYATAKPLYNREERHSFEGTV